MSLAGVEGDDAFTFDPLSTFEAQLTLSGDTGDDRVVMEGYFYGDGFVDVGGGADYVELTSEGPV